MTEEAENLMRKLTAVIEDSAADTKDILDALAALRRYFLGLK